MNVIEAIEKRREITTFTSERIPESVMAELIKSLYLAPAGNNLPSREFITVTDRKKLQELTPATPFMKWLSQAAAGIVILANPSESKYWLQDASIAGAFLWLTATSKGLGAAWGAIHHSEDATESERRESFVRERLQIPTSIRVVAIIGLGYPAVTPPAKDMYPLERVLHHEKYRL